MSDKLVQKMCYVCGFQLDDYPYHPEVLTANPEVICPCCGFHYGYDDGGAGDVIPDELAYSGWVFGDENHRKIMDFWRSLWVKGGMKWWSINPFYQPTPDWDPKKQLLNIGVKAE